MSDSYSESCDEEEEEEDSEAEAEEEDEEEVTIALFLDFFATRAASSARFAGFDSVLSDSECATAAA